MTRVERKHHNKGRTTLVSIYIGRCTSVWCMRHIKHVQQVTVIHLMSSRTYISWFIHLPIPVASNVTGMGQNLNWMPSYKRPTQNAIQIVTQTFLIPNWNRKCYQPLITCVNVKRRLRRCNLLPLTLQRRHEKPFCLQVTSVCHPQCMSLGLPRRRSVLLTQKVNLMGTPLTCTMHHRKFEFLWLNTIFQHVNQTLSQANRFSAVIPIQWAWGYCFCVRINVSTNYRPLTFTAYIDSKCQDSRRWFMTRKKHNMWQNRKAEKR